MQLYDRTIMGSGWIVQALETIHGVYFGLYITQKPVAQTVWGAILYKIDSKGFFKMSTSADAHIIQTT